MAANSSGHKGNKGRRTTTVIKNASATQIALNGSSSAAVPQSTFSQVIYNNTQKVGGDCYVSCNNNTTSLILAIISSDAWKKSSRKLILYEIIHLQVVIVAVVVVGGHVAFWNCMCSCSKSLTVVGGKCSWKMQVWHVRWQFQNDSVMKTTTRHCSCITNCWSGNKYMYT